MGSEHSRVANPNWHVDPSAAYETECWELNEGTSRDGARIAVFRSKKNEKGSLERSTKHLRKLRHPFVLRHIMSYKEKGQFYLVTELVTPLDILLAEQKLGLVDITAGLFNVLHALEFIHGKCKATHNNVCSAALFVCSSHSWKLAGFELMDTHSTEIATQSLSNVQASQVMVHGQDVLAFAELALQLLKDSDGQAIQNFLDRLQEQCVKCEPRDRPTCATLIKDPVFRNDFLDIRSFLENLMLKSIEEKETFFTTLIPRLCDLQPEVVACHLSPLLLARVVFLDGSASQHVLPRLLRPKTEDEDSEGLLPPNLFREQIIPQLINILNVHDRIVRQMLLQSFAYYIDLFSKDELITTVLPQVLLGVRDVSDEMVSASLQALAKLVLVLGAEVVVGKNRTKVFTEGTPGAPLAHLVTENTTHTQAGDLNHLGKSKTVCNSSTLKSTRNGEIEQVHSEGAEISTVIHFGELKSAIEATCKPLLIPPMRERSSPDGGESVSDDNWSDWEDDVVAVLSGAVTNHDDLPRGDNDKDVVSDLITDSQTCQTSNSSVDTGSNLASKVCVTSNMLSGLGEEFDIMAIDVKPFSKTETAEDDFFADMEPTIVVSTMLLPSYHGESVHSGQKTSRFVAVEDANQEVAGWEDTELRIEFPE